MCVCVCVCVCVDKHIGMTNIKINKTGFLFQAIMKMKFIYQVFKYVRFILGLS